MYSPLYFHQIYIRRPSGDVSWMCRIQNSSLVSDSHGEFPLADLTALFQPTKDTEIRGKVAYSSMMDMSKRIPVETLSDKEYELLVSGKGEGKTFSIFNRISGEVTPESGAESSAGKVTGPTSPKSPSEESAATAKPSSHTPESGKTEEEGGASSRQSCGPILEVDEPATVSLRRNRSATLTGGHQASLLERRTSLHSGSGAVNLIHPHQPNLGSGSSGQSPMRSREHSGTPPNPAGPNPIGMRPRSQLQQQV